MGRQAWFFFAIATFAFGSLGTAPCNGLPCVDQVDRLTLTTSNDDWFLEISAMGPCHAFLVTGSREATVQVDGAGTCVLTGTTAEAGVFRVERTVEWFTTACGNMAYGVRDAYLRTINVNKLDGGVAPD